jgi:hypothetical protein
VASTYVPQAYLAGAGVPHDVVTSSKVREALAAGTSYNAIVVTDKSVTGDPWADIRQYAQRYVRPGPARTRVSGNKRPRD